MGNPAYDARRDAERAEAERDKVVPQIPEIIGRATMMTPADLDRLIASKRKAGKHGARNCPKCGQGYMAYVVFGSSHAYSCVDCKWIELNEPPWPVRAPETRTKQHV